MGILGMSAALALAASVRMIGIGFLGRPRTLRAAAAEEAAKPVLIGMALLGSLCVPVALAPRLLLDAIQPVISLLVPGGLPQPLSYTPFPLAMLLLALAGAAFLLLRRFGARGEREVPAWNGGFGRPPSWLPFGDPVTQPSATGFAEPVRKALGGVLLNREGADPGEKYVLQPLIRLDQFFVRLAERVRRATIRQRLAFVFAALVMTLLALGLGQGG
jgi:NADH:ubiquinone oxidoreductase subunit 5 (subunit L)/multisubunit Na+/H+ antiporter MnhA subunit